jgi:tetratricopeptide (TPR) repeat protein
MRSLRAALWAAGSLLCQMLAGVGPAWALPDRPAALDAPRAEAAAAFIGSLNGLEQRLFDDAADGRLDDHSLLAAALIAAGVDDAETLRRYEDRAAALARELTDSAKPAGSPQAQAERVFEFLHRRVLREGYRIEATDLRTVLDEGRFNCVSATVLFNSLAEACGLTTCGLETPGHAMSRVRLDEGALDVETTCPRWFRLIGDPKQQAEHVEKTLGRQPAADRGALREVSPVELTAMIYYNRGVDLLGEKRFDAAAAANAKALRLDPQSKTARGNLLATINNWAIVEGTTQHYEQAVGLLRRGLAIEPSYETFVLNFVHVCHQWSLDLCLSGRYEPALEMLRGAAAEHPQQPYLRQAAYDVYRRWARERFDARDYDRAVAVLDQARREFAQARSWLEAEAAELQAWAAGLVERGQYEAAVGVYDLGLARQPDAAALRAGRQAAVQQWTVAARGR